jgi:folate-binding protein YgfZ
VSELFSRITGERAAWLDLSERGLIRVTGSDRVRFVDGMVTNGVAGLAPGDLCYAALLDRKGHLQADLFVLMLEEALLLDTAPGCHQKVAQMLEQHVVADDVSVQDETPAWGHIAVEGPAARDRLTRMELPTPAGDRLESAEWRGSPLLWVGRGGLTDSGVQALGPRAAIQSLAAELELPGLSHEQAEALRLEAFLPLYGVDMTDRNFPAEARLDHAVSFTKGCFVGQEIVARIRSRGRVHRLLVQLRTDEPVSSGVPIFVEGRQTGDVTSAVVSAATGPLALGYVHTSHARPGVEVRVGTARGVVLAPPLEEPA